MFQLARTFAHVDAGLMSDAVLSDCLSIGDTSDDSLEPDVSALAQDIQVTFEESSRLQLLLADQAGVDWTDLHDRELAFCNRLRKFEWLRRHRYGRRGHESNNPWFLTQRETLASSAVQHRSAGIMERIIGEEHFPTMVVGVHQKRAVPDLQRQTVEWLRQRPELAAVPRLFLASPRYDAVDEDYIAEATYIPLSLLGRLNGLEVHADEIIVCGGYLSECFDRAIQDMVACFLRSNRERVVIKIPQELVYWRDGFNGIKLSERRPVLYTNGKRDDSYLMLCKMIFGTFDHDRNERLFYEQVSNGQTPTFRHRRQGKEIIIQFI